MCRPLVQGLHTKFLTWSLIRFQPGLSSLFCYLLIHQVKSKLLSHRLPSHLPISAYHKKELTNKLGHMWVVKFLHASRFPEELFNVARSNDVSWKKRWEGGNEGDVPTILIQDSEALSFLGFPGGSGNRMA